MKEKIIVYTDGGARGNPGPAGSGAYITDEDGKVLKEIAKPLGVQTNNHAEYEAVILALETLKKMYGEKKIHDLDIEIRMDSELVQRQLTGKYRVKDAGLKLQFARVSALRQFDFPNVKFVHIRREQNKEADRLSNEAMDNN